MNIDLTTNVQKEDRDELTDKRPALNNSRATTKPAYKKEAQSNNNSNTRGQKISNFNK